MMLRHQPGGSRPPPGVHQTSDRSSVSDSSIGSIDNIIENTYYGDFIGPQLPTIQKSPNTFRGVSCQLGGLLSDPTHPKHKDLVDAILRHNPDVIALQEIGINFSYAGSNGDWKSRLGWNTRLNGHTTRTINAWNSNDHHKQTQQWGGTAVITRGETSFHYSGCGRDPSNLGRWCWTRYQGKNNCFLCVISFYRPCLRHNPGKLSVTAQHRNYFHTQDDDRDPRLAFMEDLNTALQEWITLGDQLIVCGDINKNIMNHHITTFFTNLGLRHLIFSKHNPTSAPATYYRNQQGESVDGVWASPPTLDLLRGGYLEKGDFPGDHRPIWFEISYAQAFGGSLPPIWKPQA
jgi:exonuclease III